MRIAILQFSPRLSEVESNIARANSILAAADLQNLDLLVSFELALTGYNHTRETILPLLEPADGGPTATWAKLNARKYSCIVSVGYPEIDPNSESGDTEDAKAYNSTITVDASGQVLAHYRKTHLYYTDEPWAQEGPDKWLVRSLPIAHDSGNPETKAAFGICMDLNPYKFTAPWTAYEFSTHALEAGAEIIVLSMAWLTSLPADEVKDKPTEPDLDTFSYWLNRLMPLMKGDRDVIVVCANRSGEEPGKNPSGQDEEGVRYAGTSWIGRIGKGRVDVWGVLGRGQEDWLVVDTAEEPIGSYRLSGNGGDGNGDAG